MESSNFHIGQVVVCIDAEGLPRPLLDRGVSACPVERGVYTIRGFRSAADELGLLLEEIHNPPTTWLNGDTSELAFRYWRFRPAKTTSLEVFEAMLAPQRADTDLVT